MYDNEIVEEPTERDDLLSYISDAHKDAYGMRPDCRRYSSLTIDELRKEADFLSGAVMDTIEREREYENDCVKEFEEDIAAMMENGAKDREMAIRWILTRDDFDQGRDTLEYFFYHKGIHNSNTVDKYSKEIGL